MRTPIITIFVVCILVLGLALAFYDYKKHGIHEKPVGISKSEADKLKRSRLAGEELSKKGKYDEAIEEFKKALQISPRDPYIRNDLGATYYYQGLESMNPPVKEEDFKLEADIDARDLDNSKAFERVKSAVEKMESGVITVVVSNEAVRKEIEAYVWPLKHYLYVEEEKTGKNSKEFLMTIIKGKTKEAFLNAEREYLQSIDILSVRDSTGRKYSNYATASRNLGTLYFRMGRKKDALAQLQRALQLEPSDAELRYIVDSYR